MLKFELILKEMISSQLPADNIIAWLNERINNTFIFFDTETTGLNRGDIGHITQIAAVAVQLNADNLRFFELDRFNMSIRLSDAVLKKLETEPDEPEGEYEKTMWRKTTIKGVLKYNHYDFVNSPNFVNEREALEKFDKYLKSHDDVILFAHNAPFDIKWVKFSELFSESTLEVYDTMSFFRTSFFPKITKLACEVPEIYKSKLEKFPPSENSTKPSTALVNLCVGFDNSINNLLLKSKNAHDALVDCLNTIEVFQEGLNLLREKI